jgi:hypothetical protein
VNPQTFENVEATRKSPRREFLRVAASGFGASLVLGWASGVGPASRGLRAEDGAGKTAVAGSGAPWQRGKAKACILVWLGGGPSQIETWDPKPEHPNGGPTKAIATAADFQLAGNFPLLAKDARDVCLVRSLTSPEGDHGRASYLLHTGYRQVGALTHPSLGSIVASELGKEDSELPHFVSIGGGAYGPGYLGVRHGPFQVQDPRRPVPYLELPEDVDRARFRGRLSLLNQLDSGYLRTKQGEFLSGHRAVRMKALSLIDSPRSKVFDVRSEPDAVKARFGSSGFGLQALMAARLVAEGVPFVEIHHGGWDTHTNNFNAVAGLATSLDPALSGLLGELRSKGLLESTLVVCMGEFGRTPRINRNNGRDHFPNCFSALLAGGGVNGASVVGATSPDGMEVKDNPVPISSLFATVLSMLRIDPKKEVRTAIGRSLKLADSGEPVAEVFG